MQATPILIILGVTIVLIAISHPIARALTKPAAPSASASPAHTATPESDARLRRLEQSVEAMTRDIERISEGQRYTMKLLTERLPIAARVPEKGQSDRTLL